MPRPRKCRNLSLNPPVLYYKPQGIPMRKIKTVSLMHEELEAISLADLQGLDQETSAKKMHISRSTFSRILSKAHKNIAQALVEGCALKIEQENTNKEE